MKDRDVDRWELLPKTSSNLVHSDIFFAITREAGAFVRFVRVPGSHVEPSDESPTIPMSVVIPCRDAEATIEETLSSVFSQTVPADEVIVVDDGSDDLTVEVVRRHFPTVTIIRSDTPLGAGEARNIGAFRAKHEWIAFLDADDLWASQHISVLKTGVHTCPGAGIVATEYVRGNKQEVLDRLSRTSSRDWHPKYRVINYLMASALRPGVVCSSAVAVNRQALSRVGGFSSVPFGQDTECWLAISLRYAVLKTSSVTAGYVTNLTGNTSRRLAQARGASVCTFDRLGWEDIGASSALAAKMLYGLEEDTPSPGTGSLKFFLISRILWKALLDLKLGNKSQCVETIAFGINAILAKDSKLTQRRVLFGLATLGTNSLELLRRFRGLLRT